MLLTNTPFSFIICLTREPKARCSLAAGKIVCYVPAAKGFAGRIFPKLSVQSVFRRDHRVAEVLPLHLHAAPAVGGQRVS